MSKYIRLYQNFPLKAQSVVELTPQAAHYLVRVMRLSEGDCFLIFNGVDGQWVARLKTVTKKCVMAEIETHERPQPQAQDISLVFAPIKAHRLSFLLEKATEIGVQTLIPILTHRTTHRNFKRDKAISTVIEACEQSERLTVPIIQPLQSLDQHLDATLDTHLTLLCDERCQGRPLVDALKDLKPARSVQLLIGPEGGWSDQELQIFEKKKGIQSVSLGANILRSETAAIVALAQMMACLKS